MTTKSATTRWSISRSSDDARPDLAISSYRCIELGTVCYTTDVLHRKRVMATMCESVWGPSEGVSPDHRGCCVVLRTVCYTANVLQQKELWQRCAGLTGDRPTTRGPTRPSTDSMVCRCVSYWARYVTSTKRLQRKKGHAVIVSYRARYATRPPEGRPQLEAAFHFSYRHMSGMSTTTFGRWIRRRRASARD